MKVFYTPANAVLEKSITTSSKSGEKLRCTRESGGVGAGYRVELNDPSITGIRLLNSAERFQTPLDFIME